MLIRKKIKEIVENIDKFELKKDNLIYDFYFFYKNIKIRIETYPFWFLDNVEMKITKTSSFCDAEQINLSNKEMSKIYKAFKERMKDKNKVSKKQDDLLNSINFKKEK